MSCLYYQISIIKRPTQHDQQHQQEEVEEVPQQQLRRSGRPHKPNPKYTNVGFFACEPQKFEEASKEEVWRKAMDEEIKMIEKNHTWENVYKRYIKGKTYSKRKNVPLYSCRKQNKGRTPQKI